MQTLMFYVITIALVMVIGALVRLRLTDQRELEDQAHQKTTLEHRLAESLLLDQDLKAMVAHKISLEKDLEDSGKALNDSLRRDLYAAYYNIELLLIELERKDSYGRK